MLPGLSTIEAGLQLLGLSVLKKKKKKPARNLQVPKLISGFLQQSKSK